ncbi:hypothetical protein ONR75_18580 [Rhodopseudomonas sp. P2A-2r]|uniref:hypothetical protein n=1 Tax=Rhodopseudomonas sp. P2A-2r TaxID=2991972 RepID=UPI00223405FF|nr:hypothetical protein [Rhodopseudomonas sp. P2A-2r]UZE47011.1 hypothetical protein ONR75_18580 [Rhodopseudomonas sp. P2A-2r]
MDEHLIHRTFTPAEDGKVHVEEVWNMTSRQDREFPPPNPMVCNMTISSELHEQLKERVAEFLRIGRMKPEAAARTTWF